MKRGRKQLSEHEECEQFLQHCEAKLEKSSGWARCLDKCSLEALQALLCIPEFSDNGLKRLKLLVLRQNPQALLECPVTVANLVHSAHTNAGCSGEEVYSML